MTSFEIEEKLRELISQERHTTHEILTVISLAESRKLYLERGYGSLFEWLTQFYGYSESAAQRRIQAARLLSAAPELKAKVVSGELNLSTLSKTQSMIRQHEKIAGQNLSSREKMEVVSRIENKSSREVEKTLFTIFPIRLEIDHKIPLSQGGSASLENLRCLCRNHNQLVAEQVLGWSMANHWRPFNR